MYGTRDWIQFQEQKAGFINFVLKIKLYEGNRHHQSG